MTALKNQRLGNRERPRMRSIEHPGKYRAMECADV
jgi:hypothetical protein